MVRQHCENGPDNVIRETSVVGRTGFGDGGSRHPWQAMFAKGETQGWTIQAVSLSPD